MVYKIETLYKKVEETMKDFYKKGANGTGNSLYKVLETFKKEFSSPYFKGKYKF